MLDDEPVLEAEDVEEGVPAGALAMRLRDHAGTVLKRAHDFELELVTRRLPDEIGQALDAIGGVGIVLEAAVADVFRGRGDIAGADAGEEGVHFFELRHWHGFNLPGV